MNELSIVFTCDEGYILPTGIAIFSLFQSKCENTSYKIYVLVDDLNIKYKEIIQSMDKPGFKIIIREIANIEKYTSLAKANRLPVSALYKFSIPEMILEEDICLSLDGDIVVKRDLGSLTKINLDDYYAAVIKDSPKTIEEYTEEKHNKYPGIFNKDYFNGGVLLLNLKKMREDNIPEKLCEYRKKGYNQSFSMNQDTFNSVLYKHVRFLPFAYNTGMHVFRYIQTEEKFHRMKKYYEIDDYKSEEDILEDAYIIHFSGKAKPWNYYDVFYADRYRLLYFDSPFKNEKLNRKNYYNDKVRKRYTEIKESKDYVIGSLVLKIPRLVNNILKRVKH